jgi:hypothetical protein
MDVSANRKFMLSEKLSRYTFKRSELRDTDLPLLMGNGEMGGLLERDGLGFPSLWFSDLWRTQEIRIPLNGFKLECRDWPQSVRRDYRQTLDIATGAAKTRIQMEDGASYESEVFFSAVDKRLLVMRVQCNRSGTWRLHLPGFDNSGAVTVPTQFQSGPHTVYACSSDNSFSRYMYIIRTNQSLTKCDDREFAVDLDERMPLTILFALHTHWSGEDFASRCEDSIAASQSFELLSRANAHAWQNLWQKTAALGLPDEELESLFYRSIYWTFCTCGSDKFLPGEAQFAHDCWRMIPYTYGGAGWSAFAYASLGHEALAQKVAREHLKCSALRHNAAKYIDYICSGDTQAFLAPPSSADPINPSIPDRSFRGCRAGRPAEGSILDGDSPLSFAHQIGLHGNCRIRRANQRGIDGFAAAMFHRVASYFPDPVFVYRYAYPALKGTAEFWRAIALWDHDLGAYTLPVLHSVSENLSERSILDATLSARGTLEMAARYAEHLECDRELVGQWREVSQRLYLPQDETHYLEYLGDTRERKGGDYFGIRGPIFLGFPWPEMIPTLDAERSRTTLRDGWERNDRGADMIGFIASWYSLSFAAFGDGDAALEALRHNLACLDRSRTTFNENPRNQKPYFVTNYTSFIVAAASMLVQSHDDIIKVFPALPSTWKDVVFHGIRAQRGISVSASMKDGRVEWISFSRNGIDILRVGEGTVFRIVSEGDAVSVRPV